MMVENLLSWPKRTWCYVQPPAVYSIQCDCCGGNNIMWSEWEKLIWCYDCQIDTPGTLGIFDGPISVELCKMLGISFERVEIRP